MRRLYSIILFLQLLLAIPTQLILCDFHDIGVPNVDFRNAPASDNKVIALTFDDGTENDALVSNLILDTLIAEKVPATFFMDLNFVNIQLEAPRQLYRRIHANGFTIGSHTEKHSDLTTLTPKQINESLGAVQAAIDGIFAGQTSTPGKLKYFRAPFGLPYLDMWDGNGPSERLTAISNQVYSLGYVHVGWSVDTSDYTCGVLHPEDPVNCVLNNTWKAVDVDKRWGVMLMHDVYRHTATALPQVIQGLKARGFRFVSVEEMIQYKYGKTSDELLKQFSAPLDNPNITPTPTPVTYTPPVASSTGPDASPIDDPTRKPPSTLNNSGVAQLQINSNAFYLGLVAIFISMLF